MMWVGSAEDTKAAGNVGDVYEELPQSANSVWRPGKTISLGLSILMLRRGREIGALGMGGGRVWGLGWPWFMNWVESTKEV